MAPRHAAARAAGLAQSSRDPRAGATYWRLKREDIGGGRPRRMTSPSISVAGGGSPARYRRFSAIAWSSVTYSKLDGRHLLESWIPLLALIAHDPRRDWTAVCIGARSEAPRRGLKGWVRPIPPSRCCVIWWRFTTPAAVSRFRCHSRRPTPGRRPGTAATTRYARGVQVEDPATDTQVRPQSPATCGCGADNAPFDDCCTRRGRARSARRGHPAGRAGRPAVAAGAAAEGSRLMDRFDLLGPLPQKAPPPCWKPARAPVRRSRWPAW